LRLLAFPLPSPCVTAPLPYDSKSNDPDKRLDFNQDL
jgi:hypothetical protein